MTETNLEFYARRLNEELRAAAASASPEAASVHRALAGIYSIELRRLRPIASVAAHARQPVVRELAHGRV